ncbi:MAG TPA: protein kinase [Micromonosporaceae bacterium]|nr:protein kinase [Micromonosporaceae bacterium]
MSSSVLDGRYRLVAPLATGGMSVVWKGHDEVLARPVAVKVINAGDAGFSDRVRREAMAVARLSHPHIATVYDYGESGGTDGHTPYIVMELLEGEDLSAVLRRGPLTWITAVGIAAQVASALTCAHSNGVVHRDITPRNVMVCADGVKLIDFGIAALAGAHPDKQIFGTPAYLAPERMSGAPIQPATDVYGLGLLLYQMLAGHLPWPLSSTNQMISAEQYASPAPLPQVRGMPGLVADLCLRCLAVDPSQRPSSADLFSSLASIGRSGDRRSRYTTANSGAAVEHRGRAGRGSAGSSRRRRRGAAGAAPAGTRVMPHGVDRLTDPDAATVPTGELADEAAAQTRRRPMFMLPTLLLSMLIGCVGLAELRPGDGGVSAAPVPPGRPPTATAPATPRTPTATPTSAPTNRPAVIAPDLPRVACGVDYRVTSQWVVGFSAQLAIANLGQTAFTDWTLEFTLGPGQRVVESWNGRWEQHGRRVTVRSVPYDRSVPAGDEVVIGFVGTLRGRPATVPARFTLNGTACG